MRKEKLWLLAVLSFGLFMVQSCKTESPEPIEEEEIIDPWTPDSLRLALNGIWRVEKVFLVQGADTFNLEEAGFDNQMFGYRKNILFRYQDLEIVFTPSDPFVDKEDRFKKHAEIHPIEYKNVNYTGLKHQWDETHNTYRLTVNSVGPPLWFPAGTAYLVKDRIVKYYSWQDAEKATAPSCLMYKVDTDHGTYLFELRQMWYFDKHPIMYDTHYYVVFP